MMQSQCSDALKNIHPRLLLGPNDINALKSRIKFGDGKIIMDALRARVRPYVDRVLACGDLIAMLLRESLHNAPSPVLWAGGTLGKCILPMDSLAMVGILDEDGEAIEAVRRVFLAMPAAEAEGPTGGNRFGARLTWNVPLGYDLIAAHLTEDERRSCAAWALDSTVQQTLAVKGPTHFKSAGANTGAVETCCTGLLFALALQGEPGVPSLDSELAQFVRMLEASLHTAIGPNGYPTEDMGYGTAMLGALAYSVEACRRAGLYDAYADCPRYAKSGRAILHFLQPWGERLAITGDCASTFPDRSFYLARLAAETGDPVLLWLLDTFSSVDDQQEATPDLTVNITLESGLHLAADAFSLAALDDLADPASAKESNVPKFFMDADRGIVSMRSGWERDDMLVVFDGSQRSPGAAGHAHASSGHFSLSALGEYFAIDAGRYCIEQDQHNVVLVDGKSGHSLNGYWRASSEHGILLEAEPGEFVDFAAVDSSHQHNCNFARRFLCMVKGKSALPYVFTVEDINKADDWAEFWWTLNTTPNNTISINGNIGTIKGCRDGSLLDVHFALPSPESFPKPHTLNLRQDVGLCNAYQYIGDNEAFMAGFRHADGFYPPWRPVLVRPRMVACVEGYNGRFMSIMIPRRKDDKAAIVERLVSIDNSLAVKIIFDEVEDVLIFAYEHNLLEADEVSGRGQWCLVRRSRSTGQVLEYALWHGTRLSVAGEVIAS